MGCSSVELGCVGSWQGAGEPGLVFWPGEGKSSRTEEGERLLRKGPGFGCVHPCCAAQSLGGAGAVARLSPALSTRAALQGPHTRGVAVLLSLML